MLEDALKLLKKIEDCGFKAYIVGGFVRDYLLGIESVDVDICTNAKPVDIKNIFNDVQISHEDYGSVTVIIRNIRYEITTFRREIKYINNRKPVEIEYINDVETDLVRRDFTINSLLIDSSGKVIDLLGGKSDLDKKIIKTIGDSDRKFSQDSLRILRAIRFASILNFELDDSVSRAIINNKELLRDLSYYRKKEELDKIFTSTNVKHGVKLLKELGLIEILELKNLEKIDNFDDLLSVWARLDVKDKYPFTKVEREQMSKIVKVLDLDNLDITVLYKYGLYVNSVVGNIKGLDKTAITKKYNELPIKSRSEIKINGAEIGEILGRVPGDYMKDVFDDLEREILFGNLANEYEDIKKYIVTKFL